MEPLTSEDYELMLSMALEDNKRVRAQNLEYQVRLTRLMNDTTNSAEPAPVPEGD